MPGRWFAFLPWRLQSLEAKYYYIALNVVSILWNSKTLSNFGAYNRATLSNKQDKAEAERTVYSDSLGMGDRLWR